NGQAAERMQSQRLARTNGDSPSGALGEKMSQLVEFLASSHLFGLSRRSRFRGDVPSQHPQFPGVAFTTINCAKVSLLLYRVASLDLNGLTPFSITPQLIAYTMRGNLIVLGEVVAEMNLL